MSATSKISRALLKWYDAHARDLPWRVSPAARKAGETPDPYRVWLSEIMLQQTTVATVAPRYAEFLARWPTIDAMAAASVDDILGAWAGLGYYARARNLHKCAVEVARAGDFPSTEENLRALPGVGAYTAAAIAAIAFDARAIVIDGNIERVASRLFLIETPLPKAKGEINDALAAHWPKKRSGDFAQALMDLGAMVCTPKNPKCLLCPLTDDCRARAEGVAETLPRKAKKTDRPTRRGVAYALINAKGEMLFERRPEKGLLGGMLGLPGSEWVQGVQPPPWGEVEIRNANFGWGCGDSAVDGFSDQSAPRPKPSAKVSASPRGGCGFATLEWKHAGAVRHTFTHFDLELDVMTARAAKSFRAAENQQWIAPEEARLPTVMKKAALLAAANRKD